MAQNKLVAGPDSPFGMSLASALAFPRPQSTTFTTPRPYLGMAFPERTIQQLVAHILGFSMQLACLPAYLCAPQRVLTALSCLYCIQAPSLGTTPPQSGQGARMRAISQHTRKMGHCPHSCFKVPLSWPPTQTYWGFWTQQSGTLRSRARELGPPLTHRWEVQ